MSQSKIDLLKYYDNLYFNEGDSPITDTEYDILRKEAKEEDPTNPYFLQVGHTIDSKFESIKLPFVMGGLEEFNPETVATWLEKENDDIVASEKLDGNSIGSSWKYGDLSFAASRGDGSKGQNIINKIKYSMPVLNKNSVVGGFDLLSLRGEVLLKGNLFKEFGLKNRRNSVAGILRRDTIDPSVLSKFTNVFYEVVEAPENVELKTEVERLSFIKDVVGLEIVRYIVVPKELPTDQKIDMLIKFLFHVKETANYDIDGLVLTRNNSARENVMHVKNKIKFKVNQAAIKCKVLGTEWNVTRLGYIKPVVLIEPTEILGVTVSRCSGFNYSFIISNFIGEGAIIGVTRAGDVIPFITEVYEQSGVVYTPTTCPSCNSKLEFTYDDDGNEVDLKCVNDQCPQKLIYQLSHFFVTMGVDGLSDKTFKNIGITSIPVIYSLTIDSFKNLPGFGEKKAKKVIDEVKKTLLTTPAKLLAAFGIPLIGKTLSKQLCSKFTIEQLFKIKDPEILALGPITSKTLIDNLPKYKDLYDFLISIGLEFEKEDQSLKTLSGIRFALTGEGPMKRSELQKLIESKGGEVRSIGKETSYLVTNDPTSASGKMKEAKKYNTPIIDYDALLAMLK
jgi:DNA ligase (NAD+)